MKTSIRLNAINPQKAVLATAIALLVTCSAGTALAAGGSITGLTLSSTNIAVGEKTKVTMTVTDGSFGIDCVGSYVVRDSTNTVVETGSKWRFVMDKPQGSSATKEMGTIALTKAGVYAVETVGAIQGNQSVACVGVAKGTLTVTPAPLVVVATPVLTLLAPISCDPLYAEQPSDKPAGELFCQKKIPTCPTNFTGYVEGATGKLICTPVPASCPAGWTGGMVGGILTCTSVPQPTVSCPAKTPAWIYGAHYFKDAWREYGCVKNNKPAN
jgi:hypothetical protein